MRLFEFSRSCGGLSVHDDVFVVVWLWCSCVCVVVVVVVWL